MAYLHLGNDVNVHMDDIIGIFDIERLTVNKDVDKFLQISQKNGQIYYVSLDLPKSFTVTDSHVYVTNVSTLTLRKRCSVKGI
ncbi:MAG: DUF370 domain-containing protein [Oscillospiraceae bacterium]|nr:DUF370 domain-containing protein [Oscillospiraceae bacterium]